MSSVTSPKQTRSEVSPFSLTETQLKPESFVTGKVYHRTNINLCIHICVFVIWTLWVLILFLSILHIVVHRNQPVVCIEATQSLRSAPGPTALHIPTQSKLPENIIIITLKPLKCECFRLLLMLVQLGLSIEKHDFRSVVYSPKNDQWGPKSEATFPLVSDFWTPHWTCTLYC